MCGFYVTCLSTQCFALVLRIFAKPYPDSVENFLLKINSLSTQDNSFVLTRLKYHLFEQKKLLDPTCQITLLYRT